LDTGTYSCQGVEIEVLIAIAKNAFDGTINFVSSDTATDVCAMISSEKSSFTGTIPMYRIVSVFCRITSKTNTLEAVRCRVRHYLYASLDQGTTPDNRKSNIAIIAERNIAALPAIR
jgi:hypothetical protein